MRSDNNAELLRSELYSLKQLTFHAVKLAGEHSIDPHPGPDMALAETCTGQASLLRNNIETQAWDGGWYRRAYFDDGTPLGSSENKECQIDSISQSWAILSGGGDAMVATSFFGLGEGI